MTTDSTVIKTDTPNIITFHLKDKNKHPISNLKIHHARILHVLIVGEDLKSIAHIHPEDFDITTQKMKEEGNYSVQFSFPKSGRYLVYADFVTEKGPSSKEFHINVIGSNKMETPELDLRTEKYFKGYQEEGDDRYIYLVSASDSETTKSEGYHVSIGQPSEIRAKKEVTLNYTFKKENQPVLDFEPYLDAPMHFAIVKRGLDEFSHAHGVPKTSNKMNHSGHHSTPKIFGPNLQVTTTFPETGYYQVFGQIKHQGKIIFTNFMVVVE